MSEKQAKEYGTEFKNLDVPKNIQIVDGNIVKIEFQSIVNITFDGNGETI